MKYLEFILTMLKIQNMPSRDLFLLETGQRKNCNPFFMICMEKKE
jgi:hypothetical protein